MFINSKTIDYENSQFYYFTKIEKVHFHTKVESTPDFNYVQSPIREEPLSECDISYEVIEDCEDLSSGSIDKSPIVEEPPIKEKEIQCDLWQENKEPDFYFECQFIGLCDKVTQVVTFKPPDDFPD